MSHSRISPLSRCATLALLIAVASFPASAQQTATANAVVPDLVNFSGTLTDTNGKAVMNLVGVTFSLYSEQQGGAPLWLETQNVRPDKNGHYTVQLGAASSQGLPSDLFSSGEARWLGVQVQGQAEQPRIMLLSVPYAMKAGDAATVGGLPPSAFVLAAPSGASGGGSSASGSGNNGAASVSGTGTEDYIPLWTNSSGALGNSILYQSGTTAVGINTTTPAATLDVNGGVIARGPLQLPSTGTATASSAFNSQAMEMTASAFNSSTGTAVPQNFQWQAEAINNDTGTASGTLNLLYATGSNTPTETGLNIGTGGLINFATGQTFPGTVTGITAGTGISVTGSKASPTVSINVPFANEYYPQLAAANTFTKGQTVQGTMTATNFSGDGAGLTNVTAMNSNELGGLAASSFAQLAATNTFTKNQKVDGNLSATGVVTSSSYQIGSNLFAFGSYANANAFLGFAGNTTTTGLDNTATGYEALYANTTTGDFNTATGSQALYENTTGSTNTATGAGALYHNTTGSSNTASGFNALTANTANYNDAFGYEALAANTTGSPNDAFGYEALYSNNSDYNDAFGYQALYSNTSGGFNNAFGYQALYSNTNVFGSGNNAFGFQALYSTNTGCNNTAVGSVALYSNTTGCQNTAVGNSALYSNTTGNDLTCVGYECTMSSDALTNATAIGAHAVVGQSNSLVLGGTGQYAAKVGIGTTTPSNILTVGRGAGHPVSDSWETYSSRRWKTNIHTLPDALSKVAQLRGVSYDLKDSGKHEIGVIAEEVGKVIPEIVTYEENGKDARGVDYSRLTALLIEATKEQQVLIYKQQQQIRAQQAQLKAQQARAKLQDAQIADLMSQVRAIQASLKTNGRSGVEVRTVKAQVPMVQQ
jgi:trimeric autotransporter adhesin